GGLDILHHEQLSQRWPAPLVLDEDRYEGYLNPTHRRYYFRRLFWAALLSGGHFSYGGLRTYEPYDGNMACLHGYFTANGDGRLMQGAHDLPQIRAFFQITGLTLVNFVPSDAMVG